MKKLLLLLFAVAVTAIPALASTILNEPFDSVTAPALPSTMTFASGFATDGTVYVSAPNCLVFSATGAVRMAESNSNDGNGGDAQATMDIRMENLGVNKETFLFVRHTASTTEYSASLQGGSGDTAGLTLYKRVSGSFTVLGSTIGASSFAANIYYRVRVRVVGTNLSAQCQRLSDNLWLQPDGSWTSTQVDATAVSDASISGAGTAGVLCYQDGADVRFDNFLFETAGGSSLASGTASANGSTGPTTAPVICGAATGGTAPYTYQWYRSITNGFTPGGGNIVSGATSLTLNDTGLTSGTTYYYKMQSTDSVPNTVTSNQVTMTTTGALGSGVLSFSTITNTAINLSWTAASGGTSSYTYKVHRSTTAGFTPSGSTPGSGTCIASQAGITYSDTTATANTLTFYKIVTDDGSNTVTSNQLTAQLQKTTTLKMWFIGDSLFQNGGLQAQDGPAGAPPILIGNSLALRLGRTTSTLNSAVGGTQTSDWQAGGTNMNAAEAAATSQFGGYSGVYAFVNLGANDAATSHHVAASTYNTNLSAIVAHLLSLGCAKVFVVQQTYIPPGGNGGATDEASVTLSVAYIPFQAAQANGTTVFYIGSWAYPYLADNINASTHTYYQDDLTHLLRTGNQAWSSGLANEIYLNLFPSGGGINGSAILGMP